MLFKVYTKPIDEMLSYCKVICGLQNIFKLLTNNSRPSENQVRAEQEKLRRGDDGNFHQVWLSNFVESNLFLSYTSSHFSSINCHDNSSCLHMHILTRFKIRSEFVSSHFVSCHIVFLLLIDFVIVQLPWPQPALLLVLLLAWRYLYQLL